MKCPNCGLEAPEGTDECPKCQLVFRKWQQSAINKAVEAQAGSRDEHKDTSSLTLRLFVMFLICAGLYWLVRPSDKLADAAAPAAPAQSAAAQPASAEGAQPASAEAAQPAAPAPIKNPWKFEGRVMDLLRGAPIEGAKLVFSDPVTAERFSAQTAFGGYYSLELKARTRGGYEVEISHPDYGGKWWEAGNVKLAKKKRYQLSGQEQVRTAEEWACHTGKTKSVVKYDFAIFPKHLMDEEKKELCEAVPDGPECSK